MTQLALGGLSLSEEQVRSALLRLSLDRRVDEPELEKVIGAWLRRVRLGQFPGFTWMMGLLDEAVLRARLRAATDLIMFRKVLLTLEGVLADVSADLRIDDVLPSLFVRKLAAEWPLRFVTSPLSRAFGTRLSSDDIARLMIQLPWTATRAWIENTRELFKDN